MKVSWLWFFYSQFRRQFTLIVGFGYLPTTDEKSGILESGISKRRSRKAGMESGI